MQHDLSEDDEGKTIVDSHGEKIGMVSEVRGGSAYVDPDPGMTDSVKTRMGWGDADEDDYQIESSRIDSVDDDQIRLRSDDM